MIRTEAIRSVPEERRRSRRSKVLLRALLFSGQTCIGFCRVRDISANGAGLGNMPFGLPEDIGLVIPSRNLAVIAKLRWRNGGLGGVSFERACPELLGTREARQATAEEMALRTGILTPN